MIQARFEGDRFRESMKIAVNNEAKSPKTCRSSILSSLINYYMIKITPYIYVRQVRILYYVKRLA